MDSYSVTIDNFEGPMDLLLYFINRDKIDINDIPISNITNKYLEYIQIMETLNSSVLTRSKLFVAYVESLRIYFILA